MKRKSNFIVILAINFLCLFLSLPPPPIFCQETRRADASALEMDMSRRLEEMIEKIVGKERSLVKVQLKLSEPPETAREVVLATELRNLPGVALPKTPPKKVEPVPKSTVSVIETIAITIYLDNKLPKEKVDEIKSSVPKWMKLDFSRGDSLKIELIAWKEVTPEDVGIKQLSFLKQNLWVIISIAVIIILGLLFLFLFMPTRKLLKEGPLGKMAQGKSRAGAEAGGSNTEDQATASADMNQEFLAALRQTIAPLGAATGGTGISPETLEVLKKIEESSRLQAEAATKTTDLLDEPFKFLNSLPIKQVKLYIEDEPARIAALVLSHIDLDKSAQILSELPEERETEISIAMATLIDTPQMPEEIKEFIKRKMSLVKLHTDSSFIAGNKALASILSSTPYNIRVELLEKIKKQNPAVYEAVKKEMFVFEDIAELEDKTIQEILKGVDRDRLTLALRKTTEEVKQKFFANVSEAELAILKKDIAAFQPATEEGGTQKKIILFEDILALDNKTFQEILKNISRDTLKTALKGVSEEVRQKFYSLMTERGAAMLKEDLEVMPAIAANLSEEAQKKILEEIQKLENLPIVAQREILKKIQQLADAGRINIKKEG
jgi:flagellar motor switch protein FliG